MQGHSIIQVRSARLLYRIAAALALLSNRVTTPTGKGHIVVLANIPADELRALRTIAKGLRDLARAKRKQNAVGILPSK